jgi:hypothetical protein
VAVLKRDRVRCRIWGKGAPLLVHHRGGHNEKRLLITLCISCHVRLHRYRGLSRWIPKVLLELWNEIHSGQPFQLQLPFAASTRAVDAKVELREQTKHPREDCSCNGAQVPPRFDIVDSRVRRTLYYNMSDDRCLGIKLVLGRTHSS